MKLVLWPSPCALTLSVLRAVLKKKIIQSTAGTDCLVAVRPWFISAFPVPCLCLVVCFLSCLCGVFHSSYINIQILCPFCTELGLEKTGLLRTGQETNTLLKPHSPCKDYAADSPLRFLDLTFMAKTLAYLEEKISSLQIRNQPPYFFQLPKEQTSPTPRKRHIHDSISGDSDKTDIMSEIKRVSSQWCCHSWLVEIH